MQINYSTCKNYNTNCKVSFTSQPDKLIDKILKNQNIGHNIDTNDYISILNYFGYIYKDSTGDDGHYESPYGFKQTFVKTGMKDGSSHWKAVTDLIHSIKLAVKYFDGELIIFHSNPSEEEIKKYQDIIQQQDKDFGGIKNTNNRFRMQLHSNNTSLTPQKEEQKPIYEDPIELSNKAFIIGSIKNQIKSNQNEIQNYLNEIKEIPVEENLYTPFQKEKINEEINNIEEEFKNNKDEYNEAIFKNDDSSLASINRELMKIKSNLDLIWINLTGINENYDTINKNFILAKNFLNDLKKEYIGLYPEKYFPLPSKTISNIENNIEKAQEELAVFKENIRMDRRNIKKINIKDKNDNFLIKKTLKEKENASRCFKEKRLEEINNFIDSIYELYETIFNLFGELTISENDYQTYKSNRNEQVKRKFENYSVNIDANSN